MMTRRSRKFYFAVYHDLQIPQRTIEPAQTLGQAVVVLEPHSKHFREFAEQGRFGLVEAPSNHQHVGAYG